MLRGLFPYEKGFSRYLYRFFGIFFGILFLFFAAGSLLPQGFWIGEHSTYSLQKKEATWKEVAVGENMAKVPLHYYVVWKLYGGGDFWAADKKWIGRVYLVGLFLCLAALLACSTYLSRFYFWISQGVWAACLYSVNIPYLRLWNRVDYLPWVVLALAMVALCYVLYRSSLSLWMRWCAICLLFATKAGLVYYMSHTSLPFDVLLHQAYFLPLAITLLFSCMVGHEVIHWMVRIVSQQRYGAFSLALPAALYLGYLLLRFMTRLELSTGGIYLSAFFWLGLSGLLGIFSYRFRKETSKDLLPHPYQWLVYVSMGCVCFATITYSHILGDDSSIEAYRQGILLTHIGFGIGFLIYIFSNFGYFIKAGWPIGDLIQKDDKMPYLVVHLSSVVLMYSLYFFSGRALDGYALSGKEIRLGILYDGKESEAHYRRAAHYSYRSHRANYSLGRMASQQGDYTDAYGYYFLASALRPTPHSLLNASNMASRLVQGGKSKEALQRGLAYFSPIKDIGYGMLLSNMALHYFKSGDYDSAWHYVSDKEKVRVRTNAWACRVDMSLEGVLEELESDASADIGVLLNRYAWYYKNGRSSFDSIRWGKARGDIGRAYVHNYFLHMMVGDIGRAYDSLSRYSVRLQDEVLLADLHYLWALSSYSLGRVGEAFHLVDRMQVLDSDYGHISAYLRALWSWSEGDEVLMRSFLSGVGDFAFADSLRSYDREYIRLGWDRSRASKGERARRLRSRWLLGEEAAVGQILFPKEEQWGILEAESLFYDTSLSLERLIEVLSYRVEEGGRGMESYADFLGMVGDSSRYEALCSLALRNPFREGLLLRSVAYLNGQAQWLMAYDLLLEGVILRPFSRSFLRAYIYQASQLSLFLHAEHTLEQMREWMDASELRLLEKEYAVWKKEAEALNRGIVW